MNFDSTDAVPSITLEGNLYGTTTTWTAEQNLLQSTETDPVTQINNNSKLIQVQAPAPETY